MKILGATYRRVFSVAEYETETFELTAEVGEEKAVDVLATLKAEVAAAYAGEGEAAGSEKKTSSKKSASKKSKAKPADDEDEEDDETTDDEETSDEDDESTEEDDEESDEETDDEETEEDSGSKKKASSKSSAKASTEKKGKVKKPQTYDRDVEEHKEIFSNVLKGVAPDWKKKESSKAKAKKVSLAMQGKAFLDADGEVLKEFKLAVKKQMAAK